jgi:uncharacterized integral membrane protein
MWRTIIIAVIIALLGIFVGQNWQGVTTVHILTWNLTTSVLVITLIAFLAGVVVAMLIVLTAKISKKRKLAAGKSKKSKKDADNVIGETDNIT